MYLTRRQFNGLSGNKLNCIASRGFFFLRVKLKKPLNYPDFFSFDSYLKLKKCIRFKK